VEDNIESKEKELLAEADRLAAEVEAEFAGNIGSNAEIPELTPEMIENMDPAQLQALIARMAEQRNKFERLPQAFYTRKQPLKAVQRAKGKAQKKARRISSKNGSGKSISLAKRRKKAA
jgi:hypothetical protein